MTFDIAVPIMSVFMHRKLEIMKFMFNWNCMLLLHEQQQNWNISQPSNRWPQQLSKWTSLWT